MEDRYGLSVGSLPSRVDEYIDEVLREGKTGLVGRILTGVYYINRYREKIDKNPFELSRDDRLVYIDELSKLTGLLRETLCKGEEDE